MSTGTLIRTISGINNQGVQTINYHQDRMKGIGAGVGVGAGTGKGTGTGRGRDAGSGHVSGNRQTLITFTPEEHHCLCAYFAAQVRIMDEYIIGHVLFCIVVLCDNMFYNDMLCYVMSHYDIL